MLKYKLLLILSIVLLLSACEDDDKTEVSLNGGLKSHNNGQNCFTCHKTGGVGEYVFTAAGSVYQLADSTKPLPNVKIVFHSEPNAIGNLIHTIEVDALGNFFTTEDIQWGSGLFVSVVSSSTYSMSFAVTNGECGQCHTVGNIIIYG